MNYLLNYKIIIAFYLFHLLAKFGICLQFFFFLQIIDNLIICNLIYSFKQEDFCEGPDNKIWSKRGRDMEAFK